MTTEYGIIGWPVSHSRSPELFAERFRRLGVDARYDLYPLEDPAALPGLIAAHPQLRGLNVTSPWKEAVVRFMDALTPEAEAVGAINVIGISRGKECDTGKAGIEGVTLTGHNTDVVGFRNSLAALLKGRQPKGESFRTLLLGTGGAAKAVEAALAQLGIDFTIVSRSGGAGRLTYSGITPEVMADTDIIINATPVGMAAMKDQRPALPYDLIDASHICHDLIYAPAETLFLKSAKAHGATVSNGLAMLRGQADAAWDFWTREELPSADGPAASPGKTTSRGQAL